MAYNTKIVLSKNVPFYEQSINIAPVRWLPFAVNCVFIDAPITEDWELRKGIAQL